MAANTTTPLFVPGVTPNPYQLPASVAVDCKATDIKAAPGRAATGQNHARFDAGHFIQDELGETLASTLLTFITDD